MYYYKIKIYIPYTGDEKIREGIVAGDTFTQAIENIESDYGKDDVLEIRFLAPLIGEGNGFCIELNELKRNFDDYGVNYDEGAEDDVRYTVNPECLKQLEAKREQDDIEAFKKF